MKRAIGTKVKVVASNSSFDGQIGIISNYAGHKGPTNKYISIGVKLEGRENIYYFYPRELKTVKC